MSTAPKGLYPLATRDGQAIPLEVIEPVGLIRKTFTAAPAAFTLPAGYELCVFYATEDCIIGFGTALAAGLVEGTPYVNTLFVPAGIAVSVYATPGTINIMGLSASGTLLIQNVRKWAALALQQQATKV